MVLFSGRGRKAATPFAGFKVYETGMLGRAIEVREKRSEVRIRRRSEG